jgi:hypothetical protein
MHRRDEIQISFRGCTFALRLHSTITRSGLRMDLHNRHCVEAPVTVVRFFERHLRWFTGISYRFGRNWSAEFEFWNHHEFADATVHERTRHILSDRRSIMETSAGGQRSASSPRCRSAKVSATRIRSSPRTAVIFSVTSMKSSCTAESGTGVWHTTRPELALIVFQRSFAPFAFAVQGLLLIPDFGCEQNRPRGAAGEENPFHVLRW